MKTITAKFAQQWATIRKAFSDLNKDTASQGYISKSELNFYLNHWGLKLTDAQFDRVYNAFDVDGDGKISYNDFQKSLGPEIYPSETLYFRQDKPHAAYQKKCKQFQCWQPACGNGNYCSMHNRMHNDEVESFYRNLYKLCDKGKWRKFTDKVQQAASPEDNFKVVELDKFERIVKSMIGLDISDEKRDLLFNTSGRVYRGSKYINIGMIY